MRQADVTLPSLGLVLFPARGAGRRSAPGRALGWACCEGVDDCGLQVGLGGLETKDSCGLSSPELGENVLWAAASQPCKIKISKCRVHRSLGGCYCSKMDRTTWRPGHGSWGADPDLLWSEACFVGMPVLMFTRRTVVLEVSTHCGVAAV